MNTEIDAFFKTSSDPPIDEQKTEKKQKKRKRIEEEPELTKKARFYCKSPEQWKVVSKYRPERLQEFVFEQEFNSQKDLHNSVFTFLHQLVAIVLDTVSKGDGHVQAEIMSDLSLRESLEQEGSQFLTYLTNRARIAALIGIDTFNGKRKEIASRPPPMHIEEIKNDHTTEETETKGGVQLPGDTQ